VKLIIFTFEQNKIMKIILYLVGFGIMGWALYEQTTEQPSIWIQIIGIVVFILLMIRLFNKTPSNTQSKDKDNLNNEL